jgi:hypothetical protein
MDRIDPHQALKQCRPGYRGGGGGGGEGFLLMASTAMHAVLCFEPDVF